MGVYAYDALRDSVEGVDPRAYQAREQITTSGGRRVSEEQIVTEMQERRRAARDDRRRYEPMWRLCQSFLAGRQWVGITRRTGRVVEERNVRKRERHTVNVLTQFFNTAKGKLYDDNFMPNIEFARPDFEAQQFTKHSVTAFEYAWEEEIGAQEVIDDILTEMLAYGTCAGRVLFNSTRGKFLGEVPVDENGRIISVNESDPGYGDLMEKINARDPSVQFKNSWEGKIEWDVLSPFNILPPPGVPRERDFPWIIIERPVLLSEVRNAYGEAAQGLSEQDVQSVDLIGDREVSSSEDPLGGTAKLRDMTLLSSMFEPPCPEYPAGRTVVWSQDRLLAHREELPVTVGGEPRVGIAFFHYHRLPRRFWSLGLVEPGVGPQRQRNRARSQYIEMKDKNLGRVYARKGSLSESNLPVGKIMELIEVKAAADMPTETSGVSPGPWISAEVEMNDADMEKVMGFRDPVNSEAMRGVTAYAAFALQAEQDDRRVGPIMARFRGSLVEMSRYTAFCMKRYWPTDKHVTLSGPDNETQAFVYNAAQLPDDVYFRYGKGAPAPRSQAAEIQKIFDIYDRSVSSGRPLGMQWLMDSLNAGKALPFPEDVNTLQKEKAQLENMLMAQGMPATVSPLDDHVLHMEEHQLALQQAVIFGRPEVASQVQMHMAAHQQGMQSQQQLVTSVPGMQGDMGALGGPQAMAANAGQGLDPMMMALMGGAGQQMTEGGK
jgi:hypothetical protein